MSSTREDFYREKRMDLVMLACILYCFRDKERTLGECINKSGLSDEKKRFFNQTIKEDIRSCYSSIKTLPEFAGLSYYCYTGKDREIARQRDRDLEYFFQTGDLDKLPFLNNTINRILDSCNFGRMFSNEILRSSGSEQMLLQRDTGDKAIAVIRDEEGRYLIVKENRWDPDYKGSWEGKWGFVKGGRKEGEKIEDAVKREVREELGINFQKEPKITKLKVVDENNYYTVSSEQLKEVESPEEIDIEMREVLRNKIKELHNSREGRYSPEYVYYIRQLMDLQGEIEKVEWVTEDELRNKPTNKSIKDYFFSDREEIKSGGYQRQERSRWIPRKWTDN